VSLGRTDKVEEMLAREKGWRAEEVAAFYLRFNGFFTLPNFAVHYDSPSQFLRTDCDLLGVRFPNTVEHGNRRRMRDHSGIVKLANGKTLFVIVEVKAGRCAVNGPWSRDESGENNLLYVIKRFGFVTVGEGRAIADTIAQQLVWEDEARKVVYLCIGSEKNSEVYATQITFQDVAAFLVERIGDHPWKLPHHTDALQIWGDFGLNLAEWSRHRIPPYCEVTDATKQELAVAITRYIEIGHF
jgi:hypothetical protein